MIAGLFNTYQDYLMSDLWKNKSNQILSEYMGCMVCGKPRYKDVRTGWLKTDEGKWKPKYEKRNQLVVHHKTYDNVGNEDQDDIIVLCHNCHNNTHNQLTI